MPSSFKMMAHEDGVRLLRKGKRSVLLHIAECVFVAVCFRRSIGGEVMRKSSASSWRSGLVRIWAIASMTILACSTAFAQTEEWPAKANVKLIVPFAAGGSADALARVLANQLQQNLSRTFFVENIPGASGVAAMQASARSAPDGYTLVLAGLGSHILAPLFAGKGAETMADYTTISMIGGPPSVLVTHPSFPVADLAAFIVKAKELNEGLSWGLLRSGNIQLSGRRIVSSGEQDQEQSCSISWSRPGYK